MIYASAKFEVATCTSNGLGKDTVTKKRDIQTDGGLTLVEGTKFIYRFFLTIKWISLNETQ